jgi:hypothetical protein
MDLISNGVRIIGAGVRKKSITCEVMRHDVTTSVRTKKMSRAKALLGLFR